MNLESPWAVVRAEYLGQHFDAGGDDDHGWYLLVAARFQSRGRATRLTLEYVSRTVGDPGVTSGLKLAQVQVIF